MKTLKLFSRIILGLVFIFSGFVKAVDPLGSAYKFHDYFQAFHLVFLNNLSIPLSIFMCTAEFIAGFSVLTGFRFKTGRLGILLLLIIFTPLTLILALTNPVSDCGCFGDAIHLTNWQTFGKNIALAAFLVPLFATKDQVKSFFTVRTEWLIIMGATSVFVLFSLYNIRYLPVIDFLPYRKGVKIEEKMVIPDGAQPDIYNTTLIYEKDGVKKEFTVKDYPAGDSTWKFIEQKSVLLRKGYKPPIHDFMITSTLGEDITNKILRDPGYSLLMVTKKLKEADQDALAKGFNLGRLCVSDSIGFYILSSSGSDEIKKYENGLNFCSADETTLKTMVRANPGYLLIKDGTILGKWSWANLPDEKWFEELIKH